MNRSFSFALAAMVTAVTVLAQNAAPPTAKAQPQPRELGLLAYKKYSVYYRPRKEKIILDYLKTVCPSVETIPEDVDIFLPENAAKLATYKRIWIPSYAAMFTEPMIDGMKRYVENGGLLISCETMPIIDVNGDNVYQIKIDKLFNRKTMHPALGVSGGNSANYSAIKVVKPTPLTEGVAENQWLPVSGSGRWVTDAAKADVLIVAKGQSKNKPEFECAFLTCRQSGKGAAIYLATVSNDENLKKIVVNVLSEKARDWLTAGETTETTH